MLIIAGSDSSSGAGVQADLKTASAFGVYATMCITAVTAQTFRSLSSITYLPVESIHAQLSCAVEASRPAAVKIGMLGTAESARAVGAFLSRLRDVPIVCDPVAVATSGASLTVDAARLAEAMQDCIFRQCAIITPNIPEAELFLGRPIGDAQCDAEALRMAWGCRAVLLKGGHGRGEECRDVLATAEGIRVFTHKRINSANTHGTGCTLSSAIAAGLALGMSLEKAVQCGIAYTSEALASGAALKFDGKGGPLFHFIKPCINTLYAAYSK